MKEKILDQYDIEKSLYESFNEKVKVMLAELLEAHAIDIHNISGRVKERNSLEKKIDIKDGKYNSLSDITDICGIRIITYLDSDVDIVAEKLKHEFEYDEENSIDKRQLKADQFGYKSLHYVLRLKPDRIALTEFKKYNGLKLEVQVRSILQHAWAEIEHDLGYKGEFSIPEVFKRNFNRISALLETADIEFDRLKAQLSDYEISVSNSIKENPNVVLIDQASIIAFNEQSDELSSLMKIIISLNDASIIEANNYSRLLIRLQFLHIKSIGELNDIIKSDFENIRKFILEFIDRKGATKVISNYTQNFALSMVAHYIAAKNIDFNQIIEYLVVGGIENALAPEIANDMVECYKLTSITK